MARDIVDDRLIGALHVRALSRAGLQHDTVDEHVAVQAGTLAALLEGGYDGDATLDALRDQVDRVARSELGAPDGEIVAVRATGRFTDLRLRSVARQRRPYRPACRSGCRAPSTGTRCSVSKVAGRTARPAGRSRPPPADRRRPHR